MPIFFFDCAVSHFWATLFIIYWIPSYIIIIDDALFISLDSSMLEKYLICEYWGLKGFPAWVVNEWTVVYQRWPLECIPMFFCFFCMIFIRSKMLKYSSVWAQCCGGQSCLENCLHSHNTVEIAGCDSENVIWFVYQFKGNV